MQDERTNDEQQAYELGCEHARNAASWVIDGNTAQDHIARVVSMLDDGDPEAYDYLPREPNLSGEYADDPTPTSLYRDVTGRDPSDEGGLSFETEHGWLMDKMADAYEAGVSDTFQPECERILRAALES